MNRMPRPVATAVPRTSPTAANHRRQVGETTDASTALKAHDQSQQRIQRHLALAARRHWRNF
jgi:hypothetical protein